MALNTDRTSHRKLNRYNDLMEYTIRPDQQLVSQGVAKISQLPSAFNVGGRMQQIPHFQQKQVNRQQLNNTSNKELYTISHAERDLTGDRHPIDPSNLTIKKMRKNNSKVKLQMLVTTTGSKQMTNTSSNIEETIPTLPQNFRKDQLMHRREASNGEGANQPSGLQN